MSESERPQGAHIDAGTRINVAVDMRTGRVQIMPYHQDPHNTVRDVGAISGAATQSRVSEVLLVLLVSVHAGFGAQGMAQVLGIERDAVATVLLIVLVVATLTGALWFFRVSFGFWSYLNGYKLGLEQGHHDRHQSFCQVVNPALTYMSGKHPQDVHFAFNGGPAGKGWHQKLRDHEGNEVTRTQWDQLAEKWNQDVLQGDQDLWPVPETPKAPH